MIPHYNRTFECPLDPAAQGPEFELMLTCRQPEPSQAHFLRQQELAAIGLDTGKVLELGIRHKISPLLYCNLRCHPAGTFSNELLDTLAAQHKRNTRRALKALHATHELVRAGQDLRLIVMKGLDVAARAYGDLAVRHVGDMDILVDPEQLDEAITILTAQGWNLDPSESLLMANKNIFLRNNYHCILSRKNSPAMELHWRATYNPFEFPIDDWPALAVSKKSVLGTAGLDNEDLMIYLCLHGAKHKWGCLKWLFDLPNMLNTNNLDWPLLWQRAHRLGAGPAIQQGLLLAHKYCGMDLSPEIKNGFRYSINPITWKTIDFIQQNPDLPAKNLPVRLKLYLWISHIQTIRKLDVLLWSCYATLFHPSAEDFQLLKLPPWLHMLYFPLRPVLWGIRQLKVR